METIAQFSLLGLLLVAGLLGGIIGFEREFSHKSAGLRTHMFVAMASTGMVLLGKFMTEMFAAGSLGVLYQTDPTRILQAIVVGISFIGGGLIFKDKGHSAIRNLSTAGSLLLTTVVGIAVALQLFIVAGGITLFIVIANVSLPRVEKKINLKEYEQE